ncbi:MAG: hypothetical protein K6F41_10835 [Lachnospira sp.]|nr:hypothetical protein [Lachnospira sp.]
MATSAICVTGFDCYSDGLGNTLTIFGQCVELVLIQIGGLGFVTTLTFFLTIFRRNISFKDRYYLSHATGSDDSPHIITFIRKLILVTFVFETIGTLLVLPAFINMRGNTPMAYFNAIFHTVSAFNNAGLDLFGGGTSFIRGAGNALIDGMSDWAYYYLCIVTMLLIVLGGLSYLALIEIFSFKKRPGQWSVHTKICITMAGILIVSGFLIFLFTDNLIKSDNKIGAFDALFMSITSRTAGFSTYNPALLSSGGRVINWILMFIGGGPLGTASGIKTTTIFVIMVAIYSYVKGRKVTAFHRSFSQSLIVKSMTVMLSSIFIIIGGFIILSAFEQSNTNYIDSFGIYEIVSAFTNTGLSVGLIPTLSLGGQITIIALMYIGRLGPMTMFSLFSNNMHIEDNKIHVNYIEEDVLIG